MEAAGLAIGAVSLASLFSACIESFNLVERGRLIGEDFVILEQKFSNLEGRFEAWGKACGLASSNGLDELRVGRDPQLRSRIEGTLNCICMLFSDGKKLRKAYGLNRITAQDLEASVGNSNTGRSRATSISSSPTDRSLSGRTLWNGSLSFQPTFAVAAAAQDGLSISRSFKGRIAATRKQSTPLTAMKWSIHDHEKFSTLIAHLRDFIEDLERLTAHLGVPARQRFFVEYEVESISDVATLERMEAARVDAHDSVADAASVRLDELRTGQRRSTSIRVSMDSKEETYNEQILADIEAVKERNRLSAATMPETLDNCWEGMDLPSFRAAQTMPKDRPEVELVKKKKKKKWLFFKRK